MPQMLFSVIIPLYNKENYIEKTINCVLAQTMELFELIVVDDGSSDNGPAIVESIRDPRIRLVQQKNAGVSAARNQGIRESQGKYIAFLDADDIWESDFLQTAKELFEQFPEAKMACPSYQVSYGKRIVHPVWKSVDLEKDSYVKDFFEMATAPFWICNSSCVAIERQALQKMDCWFPEGETVYEDFDLWIRIGSVYKAAHSNKICATYQRQTSGNARKGHTDKVVFSDRFMKTLDDLLTNCELSVWQKAWVKEIKDRRMVPFIFSLLLIGDRPTAQKELAEWSPCKKYRKYKAGLKICSKLPQAALKKVQALRMKAF